MEIFILLDRRGSMHVRWAETLGMLNAYAGSLAVVYSTGMVPITVMIFDKAEQTETPIIRDAVPALCWNDISTGEAAPPGYTPLFDSIGRTTARIVRRNPAKAVITIITDGAENASTEITGEGARAALDRLKSKGHQVVFFRCRFRSV